MTFQALVLDFDGTIMDSEGAMLRSIVEEYAAVGLTFDEAEFCNGIGTLVDDDVYLDRLADHLGPDFDLAACKLRRRAREIELAHTLPALTGVAELLCAARARELGTGIASSSGRPWVEGHLRRLELLSYFDVLCCHEDVTRHKPEPDVYAEACARLGVHPRDAVAVEDSVPGTVAARRAGLFVIAVPPPRTRHLDYGAADVVVESLAALDHAGMFGTSSRERAS